MYKVVILVTTRSAKEPGYKAYHTRIPYDFRPMSRISADIKWMPLSNQGFNYILFATCEISNYVVGIPIQKANAVTIAEATLLNRTEIVYQYFNHCLRTPKVKCCVNSQDN